MPINLSNISIKLEVSICYLKIKILHLDININLYDQKIFFEKRKGRKFGVNPQNANYID